tara:strand:+ start:1160 stop:1528 length:369 start_codon:yes stop_codon:yes gene_type:complete
MPQSESFYLKIKDKYRQFIELGHPEGSNLPQGESSAKKMNEWIETTCSSYVNDQLDDGYLGDDEGLEDEFYEMVEEYNNDLFWTGHSEDCSYIDFCCCKNAEWGEGREDSNGNLMSTGIYLS